MILAFAVFSIFLCSVQGDGVNPENNLEAKLYMKEHKRFLADIKEWLADRIKNMRADVEQTTQNFQQLPNTLIEDGKSQLALQYAHTMQEVMKSSAPQHCIAAGQQELDQLQSSNLNSFLSCKNITNGVKDIIDMGLQISKVTVQILLTANEVLNGFENCKTWNVFKFIYCTFKWVKNSFMDIYRCFQAITDFTTNMGSLISDLKHQVEYCMHGSKAAALMHHVQVLSNVQQCAAKSK